MKRPFKTMIIWRGQSSKSKGYRLTFLIRSARCVVFGGRHTILRGGAALDRTDTRALKVSPSGFCVRCNMGCMWIWSWYPSHPTSHPVSMTLCCTFPSNSRGDTALTSGCNAVKAHKGIKASCSTSQSSCEAIGHKTTSPIEARAIFRRRFSEGKNRHSQPLHGHCTF